MTKPAADNTLKEERLLNIISKTLSHSEFLGDDCAYLEEYNLVVSSDTLVEGVHFTLNTITPETLGKKALLVNISDILAAGAKPQYLTISLSGRLEEDFVKKFYKGADEICKSYGVKVIGGDLTGGTLLTIGITVFGNTKGRNISSRKNAKPGYIVLLAGEHGSSAAGLRLLSGSEDFPAAKTDKKRFIKAHLEPKLYPNVSKTVATGAKHPYAMMDTSDGLYDALKKISISSNVGFNIEFDKIPKKICDFNTVMFGGEDYGLLICLDKEDYESFKRDLPEIPVIGTVTQKTGILVDNKNVEEDLRFEHFQN